MSQRGRWFVPVAALALICAAPASAKKKNLPFTIVPGVGAATEIGGGVEKIRVHRQGLTAEVSYVTGATRRKMMAATLDIDGDPFASPPGAPARFHTFLLYLKNESGRDLHFNPATCRIVTDRGQHTYGVEYTRLYEMLRRSLTMEQIRTIAYDQEFVLKPEGRTKKLLIFEEIPGEKWEQFLLKLSLESDGVVVFDLAVPFRKLTLEQP